MPYLQVSYPNIVLGHQCWAFRRFMSEKLYCCFLKFLPPFPHPPLPWERKETYSFLEMKKGTHLFGGCVKTYHLQSTNRNRWIRNHHFLVFNPGAFTTNVVAAAPVLYCKSALNASKTVCRRLCTYCFVFHLRWKNFLSPLELPTLNFNVLL